MAFLNKRTAGNTRIFNFSTKNLALSTFILANLVSKYFSVKTCNEEKNNPICHSYPPSIIQGV